MPSTASSLPVRVRLAASAVVLVACTNHAGAESPGEQCEPLPEVLPSGAIIEYSRSDGESNKIYDLAFVADADCPEPHPVFSKPECVRLTPEQLQIMWTTLRANEVHRIEMVELDGTCHHCGSRWITVVWPPHRSCSAGYGYFTDISPETNGYFRGATMYLDGVAESVLGPRDEL
jgi:hypothetical protein